MSGVGTSARSVGAVSRRNLLRGSAALGVILVSGGLAACGRQPVTTAGGPSGPPQRGGHLRVGMVGAGKNESFNPALATSALINVARCCAVFDCLLSITPSGELKPMLATSWSTDAAAQTWTFQLRPGVRWHDGAAFTADDVIYSLRWMARPGNGLGPYIATVDLKHVKKTGPYTVVIPLKQANPLFPYSLTMAWIIKNKTTDFTKPIGTGPFVFGSLALGEQSTSRRNPDYWDTGKPYVDKLTIYSLPDDTARLNALLAGQIDIMAQVPAAQARTQLYGDVRLIRSPGTTAQCFYMAVDHPPFDDVRVRQALRLVVDRQHLVDVALLGYGSVANDLYGKGLLYYDDSLPQRVRNVRKAKALLAEAGHGAGLTLDLQTSTVAPGMVEAATLFQQQAKDANVTINVTQVDPTSYFDPTRGYLKMPFAQSFWQGFYTLTDFYSQAVVSGAYGDETHWASKHTDALVQAAIMAPNPDAAKAAWALVQAEQYDSGGYIWWGNVDNLDAVSNKVGGLIPNPYMNLGLPAGLTDAFLVS
ncbi:ABC transporter substrate-binding protein [Streptomyces sp. NPDC056291]|uniref:ABC transporter substrate-binding protein n=1 Tax=Streptomyces sp. NPDC056291 TaxID=3345772 RepID=UPI0035DBF83F